MSPIQLGFFGKVPTQGDFIRRRVSGNFLAVWDPWLRAVIDATRQSLGEHWLDIYLTSPVWRFACMAGVCGEQACMGIVMPSVDAVGRYFPLTLVAEAPESLEPFSIAATMPGWFDQAEALALTALDEQPAFDLETFDNHAETLGAELAAKIPMVSPLSFCVGEAVAAGGAHYDLAALDDLPSVLPALLGSGLAHKSGPYSLWWTRGSEHVKPGCIATQMLPAPQRFAAALDGQWQYHGWHSESLQVGCRDNPGRQSDLPAVPVFASAGVSDVGKVRRTNEDSLLEMTDRGVWAVADGVGGQDAGDLASRTLTDALRQVRGGDLQARINDARNWIEDVHEHLRHLAARPVDPVNCASTVVVLIAGAGGSAVLWVGDSRIYRLRDGRLKQCTRDHSLVQAMVDDGRLDAQDARSHEHSNVITRAVGGDANFEVDIAHTDLQAGDRFLLCSDGVHGSLDDDEITDVLGQGSCDTACIALVDLVLARGAPDNTTAIVVDALDPSRSRHSGRYMP